MATQKKKKHNEKIEEKPIEGILRFVDLIQTLLLNVRNIVLL